MNRYKVIISGIMEIIDADYIKINTENQTEAWKNNTLIGVFTKDISVYKIDN